MPTYDYTCSGCGHRFERFESIGARGPKECPKCGKKRARRMLGVGAGFIFKGSGFYTTDYKRSGSKEPEVKKTTGKETPVKETPVKEKKEEPKK